MTDDMWLGADGELIDPRELGPLDEVVARLRAYRDGELQAFLWPTAR